jgi:homoserine dehydrogenase
VLLNKTELIRTGKKELDTDGIAYNLNDIIEYATEHHLENLIAIDNTASSTFVENYIPLVDSSFDLISSNKVANTLSYGFIRN